MRAPAPKARLAASTTMFLWHGRALIVGPGIDSSPHAHYAAQISLALQSPVRVRRAPGEKWQATEAIVVAPNDTHQLDCGGARMAHLFVELPMGQASMQTCLVADYHRRAGFGPVLDALARVGSPDFAEDDAEELVARWLRCALPPLAARGNTDARVARALEWVVRHPQERPSGARLAAMVHLSASRFTHLFRQQTGMTLSRYLLWTRLLAAVEAVARGESMTGAAHVAGFSDLAHMSRSFRAAFGVVPSELQKMTIAFKQS